MAITKSAKKVIRASAKKKVFNMRRQDKIDSIVKKIKKLIREGKVGDAKNSLKDAYKAIDKAAKMNTIKKNTAARKKSRLAKLIKKIDKK